MAEEAKTSIDWSEVTGRTVERLRAPKIVPVPEAIVRLAQESFNGKPDKNNPERLLHVLSHEFKTVEIAAEFARLMKKAGAHTTPRSSVSVVINPDPEGKFGQPTTDKDVSWKAGQPRGRKPQTA